MSDGNKTEPCQEEVVRNSALSHTAQAPVVLPQNDEPTNDINQADRLVPPGLKALCDACSRMYPNQPNPLQVTTRLKYWLGGHDPLDYISMYWNPGCTEKHIPPHWHYISFGLSDLHGDGRVHPAPPLPAPTPPPPSGYGLELTFRVRSPPGAPPPLWPAATLQAAARYIFTTGNKFYAGDHISWHAGLDGAPGCRLRHLLVAEELAPPLHTVHGTVSLLQLVGCTSRELKAAQRGSGFHVLNLMREDYDSGGPYLVTNTARRVSARGVRGRGGAGAGAGGAGAGAPAAELVGVSARMRWSAWNSQQTSDSDAAELTPTVEQQIKETLQRGLTTMSTDRTGPEGHMSTDSFEMSSIERALPQIPELMQGSWRGDNKTQYFDEIHLFLNAEGASLLPLAIDGRILHDLDFTWRWGGRSVTFVPSADAPYRITDSNLQLHIPKDLAIQMSSQVSHLSRLCETDSESDSDSTSDVKPPTIPVTLTWPEYKLKISVVEDQEIL